MNRINSLF